MTDMPCLLAPGEPNSKCRPTNIQPTALSPCCGAPAPAVRALTPVQAQIVWAVRHPMDVLLSCFVQPFEGRGTAWAWDLEGMTVYLWFRILTLAFTFC